MLTRVDADAVLFLAVVEVCERSFFTTVEGCEPAQFAALIKSVASDAALEATIGGDAFRWLKASVVFDGTLSKGLVEVILPERLGSWLVQSMLGLTEDSGEPARPLSAEQTFDGVGEFANMVCGAWLTHMCGSIPFELKPPAVVRLPDHWNPLTAISGTDGTQQLASINALPLRIVVHMNTD
jgi:hypothetical protein